MKVLALIEINEITGVAEGKPLRVYGRNRTVEQTDKYFETVKELFRKQRNQDVIARNQEIRLNANFEELIQMGFVHRTELDKYFESRLDEVVQRTRIQAWIERNITKHINGWFMRTGAKIGGSMLYKNLIKQFQK